MEAAQVHVRLYIWAEKARLIGTALDFEATYRDNEQGYCMRDPHTKCYNIRCIKARFHRHQFNVSF